MYPRNAASPERIGIGSVIQISDGAVQTSGVTITVRGQAGAEGTGGGTTAYGASGIVYYTPIQSETDFTSFVVIASKTGCVPIAQTIVTTASSTPGLVVVGSNNDKTGYSLTAVTGLGNQTSNITGNLSGSVGSVTGLTAANLDVAVSTRLATAGYTAPLDAAATRAALGLAAANLDTQLGALPTAAENATAVLDEIIEAALSLRQAMRLCIAAMGGKASGLDTTTAIYRDSTDTIDRITATVDANGNRTAVTLDLT